MKRCRHLRRKVFMLALGAGLSVSVAADRAPTIVVVANKNSPLTALTGEQVADLYLGRGPGIPGVVAIDARNEKLRDLFYHRVADMSLVSVRAYWAKRVFSGRGTPPASATLEEILHMLQTDRRVITYLPARDVPLNSRILYRMGGE